MTPATALDAARQVLPPGVGYANAWVVPFSFLDALLASSTAVWLMRRALRRTDSAAWWQRARVAYPARAASIIALGIVPVVLAICLDRFRGPLSLIRPHWLTWGTLVAAFAGGVPARVRIERELLRRPIPWATWWRGLLAQAVFYPTFTAALLALPCIELGVPILLAGATSVVLVRLGFFSLLRVLRIVRPSPRLRALVERVAVGSPHAGKFRAYELAHWYANAFAYPGVPVVVFTRGALATMSDEEIEAICAHELGHTHEPRSIRLVRWLLSLAPAMFYLGVLAVVDPHPLAARAGLVATLVSLVLWLARTRIVRRLEARADAAAKAGEKEPGAYGRALARLHELNMIPLVMFGVGTHGHAYDRIAAAQGEVPPRPAPPSIRAAQLVLLVPLIAAALPVLVLRQALIADSSSSEASAVRGVVATGGDGEQLLQLANARSQNDPRGALVVYRAALAADPASIYVPVYAARACCKAGLCDEAEEMLRETDRRVKEARNFDDGAPVAQTRREVEACENRP